jgi:hypothetical protein
MKTGKSKKHKHKQKKMFEKRGEQTALNSAQDEPQATVAWELCESNHLDVVNTSQTTHRLTAKILL